nr:hypothetical protein [Candidatus Clavichlamydia salmonicola]
MNEEAPCYILITCGGPSAEGKMQVEMKYEGDPCVISYLLESAMNMMEENSDQFSN